VCGPHHTPANLFVAHGSKLPARQTERSGKWWGGGDSAYLPSASLPAVASRLQNNPGAAESEVVGAAAPTCDKEVLKVGYTAVIISESTSARRLAERQQAASQA
jgi:hypothetical protein